MTTATSTGSATAIVEIYPELKGKLNGLAVRVPLLNGSITDCVFEVKKTVTKEEVNAALKAASESGPLKGILGYETKPLVSADYTNDTRSSIIDALSTQVIDGTLIKIYAWYDNEAGMLHLDTQYRRLTTRSQMCSHSHGLFGIVLDLLFSVLFF